MKKFGVLLNYYFEQGFINMKFFNIFQKPNVTPPSTNIELDLTELNILINKYEYLIEKSIDSFADEPAFWGKIKLAFDDLLLMNLDSISYYLTNEGSDGDPFIKNKLAERIKTMTTYSAFSGWIIGKEWAKKDRNLYKYLNKKTIIEITDVPTDAMSLLYKAVNFPYNGFTIIFDGYYKSSIGNKKKHQQQSHYKDTYQSLVKGILLCFLDGVKSI